MMAEINNTQYFTFNTDPELRVKKVLDLVYNAMAEKGYNPVNQIVGYIMSGDPTYITSYKNARSMIMKVERGRAGRGAAQGVYQEPILGARSRNDPDHGT